MNPFKEVVIAFEDLMVDLANLAGFGEPRPEKDEPFEVRDPEDMP